jgi:hypothetical protein
MGMVVRMDHPGSVMVRRKREARQCRSFRQENRRPSADSASGELAVEAAVWWSAGITHAHVAAPVAGPVPW